MPFCCLEDAWLLNNRGKKLAPYDLLGRALPNQVDRKVSAALANLLEMERAQGAAE
jgi:hypothetical protein